MIDGDAVAPLLAAMLLGMFVLIFPLGYAWDLGFSGLASIAGLLSIPALRHARPPVRVVLPLVALTAWALVSMTWSRAAIDPHRLHKYADIEKLTGMKLLLQLGLYGALVAAAQRVSRRGAATALNALVFALAALAVVVLLDALRSGAAYAWISAHAGQPLTPDIARRNIAQADYVIVLFFWCAAVRATQIRWQILSVVTAGCAIGSSLFLHAVDATLAAFAFSLAAFLLVRSLRVVGVILLGVATTIYWITAPLLVLLGVQHGLIAAIRPHVQLSWEERLNMWTFAAAKIVEKPWTGWGLDASRTFGSAISLHTHDAAMQVWLELGAVGSVLAAVFWIGVWSLIEALTRRDRTAGAAAAGASVAYLTIGALSFGVWQEWWLGLGAMAAVACVCLSRSRSDLQVDSGEDLVPLAE
ncbi:MAG TPA: O-antigen ligase family protein [Caulobacteraceae bacterium]|jgi:O-antigen ligase|nr:O-antigen ligase family protein [Caulobacteraceae bacterium]